MAEISDLDVTDADNTARFPEGQAPSTVNNGARALEGLLARGLKDTIDGAVTTGGTSTVYTAASNRTLSAYYAGLELTLKFHVASGADPTLNVDSVGAKNLVWPDGTGVAASEIPQDALAKVKYDGTSFQVLTVAASPATFVTASANTTFSGTNTFSGANTFSGGTTHSGTLTMSGKPVEFAEGAAVASAGTTDIWTPDDGNTVHVTGTTTITSFGTAPQAGAWRLVTFDSELILTNGASLVLPGGANITTGSNDFALVYAETTTIMKVVFYQPAATAPLLAATQAQMEANTANDVFVTPAVFVNHRGSAKLWGYVTYSAGTPTLELSYNITSVTDTAQGRLTVTIGTDFSSENYALIPGVSDSGTDRRIIFEEASVRAAGSFELNIDNSAGTLVDPGSLSFAAYGDL